MHRFLRVPPEMNSSSTNTLVYGDRWAAFTAYGSLFFCRVYLCSFTGPLVCIYSLFEVHLPSIRVLFLGHEMDLLIFNILVYKNYDHVLYRVLKSRPQVYSVFDLVWNNSVIALVITYAVELVLRFARQVTFSIMMRHHFSFALLVNDLLSTVSMLQELGSKNLAEKTLVDDRFLI
jgi:hypothetical protein